MNQNNYIISSIEMTVFSITLTNHLQWPHPHLLCLLNILLTPLYHTSIPIYIIPFFDKTICNITRNFCLFHSKKHSNTEQSLLLKCFFPYFLPHLLLICHIKCRCHVLYFTSAKAILLRQLSPVSFHNILYLFKFL